MGEDNLAVARVRHSLGILLSWTIRKRLHLRKFTQDAVGAILGAGIYYHRDWFDQEQQ